MNEFGVAIYARIIGVAVGLLRRFWVHAIVLYAGFALGLGVAASGGQKRPHDTRVAAAKAGVAAGQLGKRR